MNKRTRAIRWSKRRCVANAQIDGQLPLARANRKFGKMLLLTLKNVQTLALTHTSNNPNAAEGHRIM